MEEKEDQVASKEDFLLVGAACWVGVLIVMAVVDGFRIIGWLFDGDFATIKTVLLGMIIAAANVAAGFILGRSDELR